MWAILAPKLAPNRLVRKVWVGRPCRPTRGGQSAGPRGSDARGREQITADSVACGHPLADCDFNQAAPHPAHPIKCR